jgi:pilus retraction protein PilT
MDKIPGVSSNGSTNQSNVLVAEPPNAQTAAPVNPPILKPTVSGAPPVPGQNQQASFQTVLHTMLRAGDKVSDLIFSPGRPPQVELSGNLEPVRIPGLTPLTAPQIKSIVELMLKGNQPANETLEKSGSADVSYSVSGLCRFRVNIFRQRGTYAIVMRVIPTKPPDYQELNLPQAVCDVADLKNGLVLVTGPTGSGKSTTLAAVIDLINATKKYHVVTIEDPIEFLHEHKLGTIHQRELHSDTPTFALALRAALRQAPKVILVGEMRDRETIEVAMEAAETGHLVLSTLHTIDACQNHRPHTRSFSEKRRGGDSHATLPIVSPDYLAASFTESRRRAYCRHRNSRFHIENARIHRERRNRRKLAYRRDERRLDGRNADVRRGYRKIHRDVVGTKESGLHTPRRHNLKLEITIWIWRNRLNRQLSRRPNRLTQMRRAVCFRKSAGSKSCLETEKRKRIGTALQARFFSFFRAD